MKADGREYGKDAKPDNKPSSKQTVFLNLCLSAFIRDFQPFFFCSLRLGVFARNLFRHAICSSKALTRANSPARKRPVAELGCLATSSGEP